MYAISISGTVSGRHESWEFDSGARDLSPEPHSLQKLVEAAAGGTGNMLDLANKVSYSDPFSTTICLRISSELIRLYLCIFSLHVLREKEVITTEVLMYLMRESSRPRKHAWLIVGLPL